MLPFTEAIYDFRTDQRQDIFTLVETPAAVTSANVTLLKALYDNDISTISITSNVSTDVPIYSSYNTTSRRLLISGLTTSNNHTLTVTYDVDALSASAALNTIIDKVPWFLLLIVIAFPPVALIAMFMRRA